MSVWLTQLGSMLIVGLGLTFGMDIVRGKLGQKLDQT
jgi:hypothetical protein